MKLSEKAVTWLRDKLKAQAATPDDLETTYEFAHPLNARRELTKLSPEPEASLMWWVRFYDQADECILEADLAREVFASQPLASQRGAKAAIAKNRLFLLKDACKRQGLAKQLYEREEALYRGWGIREIHLTAVGDGLVVWVKHFGFLPKLPDLLEEDYEDWARQQQRDPKPVLPCDLPDDFLAARGSLDLYKVL